MAAYAAFKHVELYNVGKTKKRVLRPPGGGSSDIFGADMPQTPRSIKNHMQSNIFACDKGNVKNTGEQPRRGQKPTDSYQRLFGEPQRPATPAKNHMKSNIPFGANGGDAAVQQQLLITATTNGHHHNNHSSNGKTGSVSSASSSVSSSTENLKINGVSKTAPPGDETPRNQTPHNQPSCNQTPRNETPRVCPDSSEKSTSKMTTESVQPLDIDFPCAQSPDGATARVSTQKSGISETAACFSPRSIDESGAETARTKMPILNSSNNSNNSAPLQNKYLPDEGGAQTHRAAASNTKHHFSLSRETRSLASAVPKKTCDSTMSDSGLLNPQVVRNPITGMGLGEDGVGGMRPKKLKERRDGNPVTGEGYRTTCDLQPTTPNVNGAKQVINKNRIPPGGYSSGLW